MIDVRLMHPSELGLEWSLDCEQAADRFRAQGRDCLWHADSDCLEISVSDRESEVDVLIYFHEGSLQRIETVPCEEDFDWPESDENEQAEVGRDPHEMAEARSWTRFFEVASALERSLGTPDFRSDTGDQQLFDTLYIQALAAWDRPEALYEVTWGQIGERPFIVTLTLRAPGSKGEYQYQSQRAAPNAYSRDAYVTVARDGDETTPRPKRAVPNADVPRHFFQPYRAHQAPRRPWWKLR